MSCKSCGREPENGTPTHWIGCPEAPGGRPFTTMQKEVQRIVAGVIGPLLCEYGDCTNPKRPPGKGPKPKYCTEHSDPKTRK